MSWVRAPSATPYEIRKACYQRDSRLFYFPCDVRADVRRFQESSPTPAKRIPAHSNLSWVYSTSGYGCQHGAYCFAILVCALTSALTNAALTSLSALALIFPCEAALLGVIGALARVIMVASSSGTRSAMAAGNHAGNHAGIHVLLGVL